MEEILADINWIAVVVGAVASFALGSLWYSPKMFGTKWMQGVGLTEENKGPMMPAMITQAVGTFLFAWVIGITETTNSLLTAILIAVTIATLIKAAGLWSNKSMYAIRTEAGFILAMAVVMIAAHAVL